MFGGDRFRERLLERLIAATGVSSTGLALATACGGKAEVGQVAHTDHQGGAGTGAGSGGGASAGGSVSTGGTGGSIIGAGGSIIGAGGSIIGAGGSIIGAGGSIIGAGGSIIGAGGSIIGAGGSIIGGTGGAPGERTASVCVSPHDAGPDATIEAGTALCDEAKGGLQPTTYYVGLTCGTRGGTVTFDGPRIEGQACCYDVYVKCFVYVGRAFLVDEGLLKAVVRKGAGWRTGPSPCTDGLSTATRRALAEAWVKDALFEHASVATFARFAIQLLAVGAPSRLLHDTLAAGRDEIRHAELCFALASAYAGEPLEPDRFPIDDDVRVNTDLAAIIEETIVEGCIGETLAALQAAEQASRASDPVVVESLESTVEDETRHAELAWRVTAWALDVGGERVRRVVERTFADFRPPDAPIIDLEGVNGDDFLAHGRLKPEEARATALEALEHVVRPCAAALLGIDVMAKTPCTFASRLLPTALAT